jgi:pilus assembly protein CpaD
MSERLNGGTSLLGRMAAVALAGAALAGCDRHMTTGSIPEDYRQRHQINLVRATETMEVFIGRGAGSLDRRQKEDVQGFARDYMQNGEGPLVAYLPMGTDGRAVNAGLAAIRGALGAGGAGGRLHIAHYQPEAPGAAPIKLGFAKLKAQTPEACSVADGDLAGVRFRENNTNVSPHNFGCSFQRNFAAQVADPRDFAKPRQEGPVDVERRTTGIERIREGDANELKPGGKSLRTIVTE